MSLKLRKSDGNPCRPAVGLRVDRQRQIRDCVAETCCLEPVNVCRARCPSQSHRIRWARALGQVFGASSFQIQTFGVDASCKREKQCELKSISFPLFSFQFIKSPKWLLTHQIKGWKGGIMWLFWRVVESVKSIYTQTCALFATVIIANSLSPGIEYDYGMFAGVLTLPPKRESLCLPKSEQFNFRIVRPPKLAQKLLKRVDAEEDQQKCIGLLVDICSHRAPFGQGGLLFSDLPDSLKMQIPLSSFQSALIIHLGFFCVFRFRMADEWNGRQINVWPFLRQPN